MKMNREPRRRCQTLVIAAALAGATVPALQADEQPGALPNTAPRPPMSAFVRDWTRYEAWSFFEPNPGGGDPQYGYIANRLLFGLQRQAKRYEVVGAVQYVQFGGLPARATGPGQLGAGSTYYATNLSTDPGQLYLKYLSLTLKDMAPGFNVRVGRMAFASGAEGASGAPKIEAVKRQRVDSRLVGEFEWSIFQRSFDGVRVDLQQPSWQATGVAFHPTQGGFERDANRDIADIGVLGGALTLKPARPLPGTEWQVFTYRYTDSRAVAGRPDNTGLAASRADVRITSFGTTLVGAYGARHGQVDALLWLVGQSGDWYGQSHGAHAVAAEAGYQWTSAPGRPWVRAGIQRASGDADPRDATHGTFFPMLPTARKYALSATYAFMNLDDRFAQVMLRPSARMNVRIDVHRLNLAAAADRWYTGSGATQASGAIFGYSGRASSGATLFGTIAEGSADYTVSRHWSVNGYVGVMKGGDVVQRTFAGDRLVFAYVENVLQF